MYVVGISLVLGLICFILKKVRLDLELVGGYEGKCFFKGWSQATVDEPDKRQVFFVTGLVRCVTSISLAFPHVMIS